MFLPRRHKSTGKFTDDMCLKARLLIVVLMLNGSRIEVEMTNPPNKGGEELKRKAGTPVDVPA